MGAVLFFQCQVVNTIKTNEALGFASELRA